MAHNSTMPIICSFEEDLEVFKQHHLAIAIFNLIIATISVILNSGFTIVLRKSNFSNAPSNALLLSLAVVDLLTGAISQTSFAVENILFSRCIFSRALDIFVAVSGHLLGAMSYTTVILVSLDRYVAILYPFFYDINVTRHRLILIQFMVWLLPMPLLLFSVFHKSQLSLYYTLIIFTVTGWLLSVYFYGKILAVAYSITKSERKIRDAVTASTLHNPSSSDSSVSAYTVGSVLQPRPRRRTFKMQRELRRALTTVICIMSALIASFTPITAFSIYMLTRQDLGTNYFDQIILHWVQSISLVNGLLNPLIYCFRMTDAKRELFKMIGISQSSNVRL